MIEKIKCFIGDKCGNCQLLNMTYKETLDYKISYVNKLLQEARINKKVTEIVPCNLNTEYRNKMIVGFHKEQGKIVSGFYEENSHKIVSLDKCLLHSETQNNIAKYILRLIQELRLLPYDEDRKTGLIRYVLIREAFNTKEVLVTIIIANDNFPARSVFVKRLREQFPMIKTIVQNVNPRKTSIVLGEKERILFGDGFIFDKMFDLKFMISSKSFYQINSLQTIKLYQIVKDYLKLSKNETIIDAYSGIGTIGMILAPHCKEVISVENNKQSVSMAIENAKNNKIRNISFILDDATMFLKNFIKTTPIDAIIMDPPRTGSTVEFLDAVCRIKPKQLVYVSCGPDTLVRDLKVLLKGGFIIKEIKCVDLFCWTKHVETVVYLQRK